MPRTRPSDPARQLRPASAGADDDRTDASEAGGDVRVSTPARPGDHNLVTLRGRITSAPRGRVLPSGDEVVALAVTVGRPGGGVDTLPVQVGPAPPAGRRPGSGQVGRRLLGRARRLSVEDRVEVVGTLRRRWWEAGGGRRSRVEVAAQQLEILTGQEAAPGSAGR